MVGERIGNPSQGPRLWPACFPCHRAHVLLHRSRFHDGTCTCRDVHTCFSLQGSIHLGQQQEDLLAPALCLATRWRSSRHGFCTQQPSFLEKPPRVSLVKSISVILTDQPQTPQHKTETSFQVHGKTEKRRLLLTSGFLWTESETQPAERSSPTGCPVASTGALRLQGSGCGFLSNSP